MIITGINKSDTNITLYTTYDTISFKLYKTDTPDQIIFELIQEGFKILNLEHLKKLLKIVLYTRFTSIV